MIEPALFGSAGAGPTAYLSTGGANGLMLPPLNQTHYRADLGSFATAAGWISAREAHHSRREGCSTIQLNDLRILRAADRGASGTARRLSRRLIRQLLAS